MTPEAYRTHRSSSLRRAFWRGVDAARGHRALDANPYWTVGVEHKARRGSWSEAYATAWAVGWQSEQSPGSGPAEPSGLSAVREVIS